MTLNRRRLAVTGVAALALTLIGAQIIAVADDARPNIVVIMCDDLGYADVGFNGGKDVMTPELDRLANSGTILTSAYVTHPFCGPSRMGLVTGRYPHTFGAPFNLPNSGLGIESYNREGVDVGETLISTVLQKAGYFTGAIGKWHMGTEPEYHPNARGFDEFYGFLGGGHKYFPEQFQNVYERQRARDVKHVNDYIAPLRHNGEDVVETEYLTDGLSREAVRFVNEAAMREQPFFLYLAYNAPHSPLEAKEEDLAKFASIVDKKRRTYAAMVYAVDRGVGELVEALQSVGAAERTLIVFLSDNGGKIGLGADNGPLRDGKGSTHEGGYRVPMFFHWPGHVPAGRRYDYPISALDFYPTFSRLAQADVPAGKRLDGKDVWNDVVAGRNPREGETIYALRHRRGGSDVGIRRDQWKAVRTDNAGWQLFNLSDDIGEERDLSGRYPAVLRELVSGAETWSRSHTQPRWFDNLQAETQWKATGMPNYDQTFRVD